MEEPFHQDDVVGRIAALMRRAEVEGLPQNYALFHQAYVGSNKELRHHLETLGPRPTQDCLDELFSQFGAEAEFSRLVEGTHDRVLSAVREIMELLSREQGSLQRYAQLLDSTASGMEGKVMGQAALQKIAAILAKATTAAVKQSQDSVDSIAAQSNELQDIRQELEAYKVLADTDHLTQLGNSRAFSRSMNEIYQESRLTLQSSLAILDIDRFKDINDRYGHLAGDQVLQTVARILKSKCGPHVSVFRVGGEEFALIIKGGSENSTRELVEGIRKSIEQYRFGDQVSGFSTTVSAGVCQAVDASGADDLFDKADSALYVSKSQGRNRVTFHPLPVQPDAAHQRRNWLLYQED